jgi:RNA polymerase sigma factor (sigma-70 family)
MKCQSRSEEMELVIRIVGGCHDLFWDLLRPHLAGLTRIVRARVRDDTAAEDVVQETILKAFAGLNRLRFDASFNTWLVRIALNEVSTWRRKRPGWLFLASDEEVLAQLGPGSSVPMPYDECECRQRTAAIHKALARLPANYQMIVHLRDLLGLGCAETAELIQVWSSTARTRHRRARQQMSRYLELAGIKGANPYPSSVTSIVPKRSAQATGW